MLPLEYFELLSQQTPRPANQLPLTHPIPSPLPPPPPLTDTGALAGLVSITSACAVVEPWAACLIGVGGALSYTLGRNGLRQNSLLPYSCFYFSLLCSHTGLGSICTGSHTVCRSEASEKTASDPYSIARTCRISLSIFDSSH